MSKFKISVVTPSYNQGRLLEETLRSVIDQGYENLEYIVIDGGSTDGSIEILTRYEKYLHYWVSERDEGQTDALVKGFSLATGDILCWLNSDDLFEPWTLQEVARFFEGSPHAQVVYGDATWINAESDMIRPKKEHPFSRFIWLNTYNYIPQPSMFWRREVYKLVGGLDPAFNLAMDADLWIRFSDVTHIFHIRRPWSRMRLYPEQKNQRLRHESDAEDKLIRNRYFGTTWMGARVPAAVAARALRVAWKVTTGCYRGGE